MKKGKLRLIPTNIKIEPVTRFEKFKNDEFVPVIVSDYRPHEPPDEYLAYDKFWDKYRFSRLIMYQTPVEHTLFDKLKIKKILLNPEDFPKDLLEDIKNGKFKDGDEIEF